MSDTGAMHGGEREGWIRDNWGNEHEVSRLSRDMAMHMLITRVGALGACLAVGRECTPGEMITVREAVCLARRIEDDERAGL